MKRPWLYISIAVALGIMLGFSGVYLLAASRSPAVEGIAITGLDAGTIDPAVFGQYYPVHYESYKKMSEMNPPAASYGGSQPVQNLDIFPYMRDNWAGFGFAKDFKEDRGHTYTLEDITETGRPHPAANCWYCKSASVPQLEQQHGVALFSMNWEDIKPEMMTHPISCSDCHDPQTMSLRISRNSLVEGLKRVGVDVAKATRQEMRTYVCAQCHVEYYFDPQTKQVVFPWHQGIEAEQQYQFYQEIGYKDYEHQISGHAAIKAQHPEFEMYAGSVHQANGLACADCHMPFMKQGTAKISSHWVTSPLRTVEESCLVCHKGTPQSMEDRVLYTQDKYRDALDRAGFAVQSAIKAVAKAAESGADPAKLQEARDLLREAHYYWDWAGAENSAGFHNPAKSLSVLAKSIDLAHQAELKAAATQH